MASMINRLARRLGYVHLAEVERLVQAHLEVDRASKDWALAEGTQQGLIEAFHLVKYDYRGAEQVINARVDAPQSAAAARWRTLGTVAYRLLEAYEEAGVLTRYQVLTGQVLSGQLPPPGDEPPDGFDYRGDNVSSNAASD